MLWLSTDVPCVESNDFEPLKNKNAPRNIQKVFDKTCFPFFSVALQIPSTQQCDF